MKMTGMGLPLAASSLWSSRPLILGNRTSRMMQLGASGRVVRRNSVADPIASTRRPTDSTRRLIARRTEASSSITNTWGEASAMRNLRSDGQDELENRAILSWDDGQAAPMRFRDRAADRQTQT